jgi:hypothetical protein
MSIAGWRAMSNALNYLSKEGERLEGDVGTGEKVAGENRGRRERGVLQKRGRARGERRGEWRTTK